MLPFIKKKDSGGIAGVIIKNREPDQQPAEDTPYSIVDCCKDILQAINANDAEALASALKEAMTKASEPEAESVSPHTYESQES